MMKSFAAIYTYSDLEGWKKHMPAHVFYLQELIKANVLRVAGPISNIAEKSDFLLLIAPTREDADECVKTDPYFQHGVIANYTLMEFTPVFGRL